MLLIPGGVRHAVRVRIVVQIVVEVNHGLQLAAFSVRVVCEPGRQGGVSRAIDPFTVLSSEVGQCERANTARLRGVLAVDTRGVLSVCHVVLIDFERD